MIDLLDQLDQYSVTSVGEINGHTGQPVRHPLIFRPGLPEPRSTPLRSSVELVRGVVEAQLCAQITCLAAGKDLRRAPVATVEIDGDRVTRPIPHRHGVVLHALALTVARAPELVARRLRRPVVRNRPVEIRYRAGATSPVVQAELAALAHAVAGGSRRRWARRT